MEFKTYISNNVPEEYGDIKSAVDSLIMGFIDNVAEKAEELNLESGNDQLTMLTSCCSGFISGTMQTLVQMGMSITDAGDLFRKSIAHTENLLGESDGKKPN